MRKELGKRGVLVGAGRADEVALGAPECMPGECGSGQFVVPLASSETDRAGLFLPAGTSTRGAPPAEAGERGGDGPHGYCGPGCPRRRRRPPPCGAPPPEPKSGLSGRRASGHVPHLPRVERGPRDPESRAVASFEETARPPTTRFASACWRHATGRARPARGMRRRGDRARGCRCRWRSFREAARGEVRVLWFREEGICCPSAASTWVTDVGERASDGPRHVAGFGQPCD